MNDRKKKNQRIRAMRKSIRENPPPKALERELILAIMSSLYDFELVKDLVEAIVEENIKYNTVLKKKGLKPPSLDATTTEQNITMGPPVSEAIFLGYSDAIKLLLDNKANPNVGPFTPLMRAAEERRPDFIEMLLKAKADPFLKTRSFFCAGGKTALDVAREHKNPQCIDLLIKAEAQAKSKHKWYGRFSFSCKSKQAQKAKETNPSKTRLNQP